MRVHLEVEAAPAELEGKSAQFLDALAQALEQSPELAKALGAAAQGAREAAPARPGYPAMDALLERGRQVYVQRVGQMVAAIGRVLDREPVAQKSLGPDGGWAELDEQVGEHLWAMLGLGDSADAQDLLEKAVVAPGQPKAGHKYLRRVPYTDKAGKRRYRYYYTAQAMGRQAQAGEEVRVGRRRLSVTEVDAQGQVTFEEDEEGGGEGEDAPKEPGGSKVPSEGAQGEQAPKKRKKRTVSAEEWAAELAAHYGEVVEQSMERRARQAVRAVTKLVPPDLLADLKGETDADRMEELAQRVPSVFDRLKKAFQRAGIDPWRAKHVIARALTRRGWADEGRAAAIGCVLSPEGSQLARRHVQLLDAAENLAGGRKVRAQNVQAAAELMQAGPDQFAKVVKDTAERAEAELVRLHQLLEAARAAPAAGQPAPAVPQGQPQGQQAVGELLQAALSSPAVKQLLALAQAFPGLRDRAIPVAQQIVQQVPAAAPRKEPVTGGSPTQVFVAGEGGRPRALQARYKLVEASDLQASHVPGEGFQANPAYPKDVQERAYHRDKQEQLKVLRNAKQLNPAFVANTNPDAVNGPPLVTASGVVLGGNSRTMSMQQAYSAHPEKAKELQQYLEEHAHEFGLKPEDVRALRSPVLVRVVDVEDQSPAALRLLVRQFNESFTQSMDPRTMQVAMGRKLDDRALEDLAAGMQSGETLDAFLGSSRAEAFVQALYRAGVIDDRNSNQFVKKGTKFLNEDGKMLVGRVLVGRMVGDADLLSETRQKALESIANSVPSMTQAKVAGPGFDLSKPLAVAMSALNTLQSKVDAGLMKPLDSKVTAEEIGQLTRNFLQDLFGERHPVLDDPRAMSMLEVFIRRPGPQQMARVFREYARLARENPEGQGGLFGASKSPAEVFRLAVETAGKREAEEAAQEKAARGQPKVKVVKRKIGGKAEPEPAAEAAEDTGSAVPASGVPEEQAGLWSLDAREEGLEDLEKASRPPAHQGGPYIGPRGGKWADPEHTIPWDPTQHAQTSIFDFQPPPGARSAADQPAKMADPRVRAISQVEDKIRGLDVEHVHFLGERGEPLGEPLKGDRSSCRIMPEVLAGARKHGQATLTHNHPDNMCFSKEDLFLAVQFNLKELRAVTKAGAFVLTRPAGGWLPEGKVWKDALEPVQGAFSAGYEKACDTMIAYLEEVSRGMAGGGPAADENHPAYTEEKWHEILAQEQLRAYQQDLGKRFGWEFRFEPTGSGGGGRPAKPEGGGEEGAAPGRAGEAEVSGKAEGQQQDLLSSEKKEPPAELPHVAKMKEIAQRFGTNRKANLAIAVEAFKALGVPVRMLSREDPAHIREGIKKKGAAFHLDGEIVINPHAKMWGDPKGRQKEFGDEGKRFYSSGDPARFFLHEYAHYLFDDSGVSDEHMANNHTLRAKVKAEVGEYAASSMKEFISEVYAATALGKKFSDYIMGEYNHAKRERRRPPELNKAGPYVGPKGGLWEDPQHTRHWDPKEHQGTPLAAGAPEGPSAPAPEQLSLLDRLEIVRRDPALTPEQKALPVSPELQSVAQQIPHRARNPVEWQLPAGARVDDPYKDPPLDPEAVWEHPDYGTGKGLAPWEDKAWAPDLSTYDYVVINSSAGKDSQAMLSRLVELAKAQGYPLEKLVVVHADLGRVEWEGTKSLAQQQAEHYGLRFEAVRRQQNDLVDQIEERRGDLVQKTTDVQVLADQGVQTWWQLAALTPEAVEKIIGAGKGQSKWEGAHRAAELVKKAQKAKDPAGKVDFGKAIPWPSMDARFCTSDHKRAEIEKLLTKFAEDYRSAGGKGKAKVLNCLGIRAQESTGRLKQPPFRRETGTGRKDVDRWYPIHRWTEKEVWEKIAESGVPHHKAYSLGMRRLSCVFCVFASHEDLLVAATHNPDLFTTYLELEERIGFPFKKDHSLAEIAAEIKKRKEEGYHLNELAQWVRKALGLGDDDVALDLVKAIVEGEPENLSMGLLGLVLEAAHARLSRLGETPVTLALDWKQGGLCVHLDSEARSHHVEFVAYPGANQASLLAAGFARGKGLQLEEHNAPQQVVVEEGLEKAGPYVGPKGGLWEDPQHTRHWDPKEHQGARRGAQLGLFAARAPVAGDSAQQVEAKQLPVDVRPERPEEVGGEPAGQAEPKPHPGGGRQDVAAEGQEGEPEIWTVADVEDLRPLDFWSGKRLPIPAEAMRVCERCGRQHAVVVTLHSSKGRSAEVGSGCGPALAGGEKYYDNEGQRKAERELKKKAKAAYLQKVKDWLESESAALEEKHLRAVAYPGGEVAMVTSKQVDAVPGEMRRVLRTLDGLAEVWFPGHSNLEERQKALQSAWVWRVVHQVMQKLQAKGSDWRWPAVWPTKAPGMDALHAVAARLESRLRDRLAKP